MVSTRPSAILRRTGSGSVDANLVLLPILSFFGARDLNVMLPLVAEIVNVLQMPRRHAKETI